MSSAIAIEAMRRTCLVVAANGADVSSMRKLLQERDVDLRLLSSLPPIGATLLDQLQFALEEADIVVFVLTGPTISPNMYFEMGLAVGLHKRLMIVAPVGVAETASDLHNLLIVRAQLDDDAALGFSLDQLLAAPQPPQEPAKALTALAGGQPLEDRAEALVKRAELLRRGIEHSSSDVNAYREFEQIVTMALQSSNVAPIVVGPIVGRDQGRAGRPDLAVWVDELDSLGVNPLIIELKPRLHSSDSLMAATAQMHAYMHDFRTQAGLVIYVVGPRSDDGALALLSRNILGVSLSSLLDEMRTRSFGDILWGAFSESAAAFGG